MTKERSNSYALGLAELINEGYCDGGFEVCIAELIEPIFCNMSAAHRDIGTVQEINGTRATRRQTARDKHAEDGDTCLEGNCEGDVVEDTKTR